MGQTNTSLEVHAHHSPVVVSYTHAGWTDRPDGTPQGGQLVFIANAELLQGKESNVSLVSWHSSRRNRVEYSHLQQKLKQQQTAMMLFSIHLCLKEVLFIALSWCLRRFGSLFVLLCWFQGQEIWPGSVCSQTKSC